MKYQVAILLAFLSVISYSQITPIITFNDIISVYGAKDITFRARSNSNANIIYNIVTGKDQIVSRVNDSTVHIIGAGTAKIKASLLETEEYKAAEKEINLSISKKNLYVKANNDTILYGESPNYKCTYTGWVYGDVESSLDEPPNASSTASTSSSPGTYPIKVSGGKDKNYFFIGESGTLTIIKRSLNIMINDISRPYGEKNPPIDIKYDGFRSGDNPTVLSSEPVWSCTADSASDVGSYDIMLMGGDDENYDIQLIPGKLFITKATLVVTIDDVSRIYGDSNLPFNQPRYTGFKLGHDQSIFEALPGVYAPDVEANSPAGIYPIYYTPSFPVLKAGYSDNYDLISVQGIFTILPAPFDITFHPMNRWVGTDNPRLKFDFDTTQFKLDHKLSDLIPDTALNVSCTSGSEPGSYEISFKNVHDRNPNYSYRETGAVLNIIDFPHLSKTIDPISTCKNVNCVLNPKNSALDVDIYTWLISDDDVSFDTIRPGNGFSGINTNFLQIDTVRDGDEKKFFRCLVERSFYTDVQEKTGKQSDKDSSGTMQIELMDTPSNASIYFKPDHTLICLDDSVSSYQWGLGENILPDETKQFYYDNNLQIDNLGSYWVNTAFDNGCVTKSAYSGQPDIPAGDQMQDIGITPTPNPNKGDFQIHISNLITNMDVLISIHKYSGALMETARIIHHYGDTDSYHRKKIYGSGQYIIVVSQGNRRSIAKMIVEN